MAAIEGRHEPLVAGTPAEQTPRLGTHLFFGPSGETPTVITANGGAIDVDDETLVLEGGLDLLGEGSICFVTPTVTRDGCYRHQSGSPMLPSAADLALKHPLPGALLSLRPAAASSAVGTRLGGSLRKGKAKGPGRPSTKDEVKDFIALFNNLGIEVESEGDYLCPWHDDTRPSLHITPGQCVFTCWTCSTQGGLKVLRQLTQEHEPHALHEGGLGTTYGEREVLAFPTSPHPPHPRHETPHEEGLQRCPHPVPVVFRLDKALTSGKRTCVPCKQHTCSYCGPKTRSMQASSVAVALGHVADTIFATTIPNTPKAKGALRARESYWGRKTGKEIYRASMPSPDGLLTIVFTTDPRRGDPVADVVGAVRQALDGIERTPGHEGSRFSANGALRKLMTASVIDHPPAHVYLRITSTNHFEMEANRNHEDPDSDLDTPPLGTDDFEQWASKRGIRTRDEYRIDDRQADESEVS